VPPFLYEAAGPWQEIRMEGETHSSVLFAIYLISVIILATTSDINSSSTLVQFLKENNIES
jgi:hypothetical protein